jgi:hypothetical protein
MADRSVIIDRVVLTGLALPVANGEALGRDLATELEQLIRTRGWPSATTREHVTAPPLASDERLASSLAEAIYESLDR